MVQEEPLWAADRHDELVNGLVGNRSHLVVGAVLNRVFYKQTSGIEAQCIGLGLGSIDEGIAGDKHTRKSAAFKVGDVMHTA